MDTQLIRQKADEPGAVNGLLRSVTDPRGWWAYGILVIGVLIIHAILFQPESGYRVTASPSRAAGYPGGGGADLNP